MHRYTVSVVAVIIIIYYYYLNLSDDRQPINVYAIFGVLLLFFVFFF